MIRTQITNFDFIYIRLHRIKNQKYETTLICYPKITILKYKTCLNYFFKKMLLVSLCFNYVHSL